MPQLVAHLPYGKPLDDLVDQIVAQAPGSSGFDTGEVLIVVEGVRSASTVAPLLRLEVVRTEDETAFRSMCLWVMDRPGLEDEVAALADQLRASVSAYRIVCIDAPEGRVRAIADLLAVP